MTDAPKRGRPKKDPEAPKQRYFLSAAEKARRQTQKRLRDAKKRAEKTTKVAESKRRYARKLEEKVGKVEKALKGDATTVIDTGELASLPPPVQELVGNREVVFQPNEGP